MRAFVLIVIFAATGMFALCLALVIARFRRFMEGRDEGPYGPTTRRSHKGVAPSRAGNAISEAGLTDTRDHNAEARGTEWVLNHLGTVTVSCTPLHEEPFTWAVPTEPQSPGESDPTNAPDNDPLPRGRGQDSGNDV